MRQSLRGWREKRSREQQAMNEERTQRLLDVLRDTRALLARPENDFSWSSWTDTDHALGEIDRLIATIESGAPWQPHAASVLFLPTGPIQEVSLSSGWGNEFLTLAARFDKAIGAL